MLLGIICQHFHDIFFDFDAINIDQLIHISQSTLFKNFTCVAKLMRFHKDRDFLKENVGSKIQLR